MECPGAGRWSPSQNKIMNRIKRKAKVKSVQSFNDIFSTLENHFTPQIDLFNPSGLLAETGSSDINFSSDYLRTQLAQVAVSWQWGDQRCDVWSPSLPLTLSLSNSHTSTHTLTLSHSQSPTLSRWHSLFQTHALALTDTLLSRCARCGTRRVMHALSLSLSLSLLWALSASVSVSLSLSLSHTHTL